MTFHCQINLMKRRVPQVLYMLFNLYSIEATLRFKCNVVSLQTLTLRNKGANLEGRSE